MTKSWIRADFLCMMMIWTSSSLGNGKFKQWGVISWGWVMIALCKTEVCFIFLVA